MGEWLEPLLDGNGGRAFAVTWAYKAAKVDWASGA